MQINNGGISIGIKEEFEQDDMKTMGLIFGSFSFLVAFLLMSATKMIWTINSASKAILFMIGIFLAANILCYKASLFALKKNPDRSMYSKKVMIVGGSVIFLMSLFVGMIVVMSAA